MKSICRRPVIVIFGVALLAVYLAMPDSRRPECSLDYTANMSTEENIQYYGYPYEKHLVQTEDGYILSLIRLPRRNSDKLPVLIVHGFTASSNSWIAMGPEGSLGYKLYDEGYDVWLGDLRGNSYSIQHSFLKTNESEFWDFSFDEMGRFDQPAFVEHILHETGHKSLVHVGYSMGSGSLFIMSAMRPEYNEKIQTHIALAPAVFLKNSTSTFWWHFDFFILVNEYLNEIPGSYSHGLMPKAFKTLCNLNYLSRLACKHLINGILGPSNSNKNESVFQVILHNGMIGSSIKTARHFRQLHESDGRFQRYDYGDEESNLKIYGQKTPPQYDLSKADIPTHIFYGATDVVCPEQGVKMLKEALPGPVELARVDAPLFNHGDFFMSIDAKTALNPNVLEKIRQVNENHKRKKISVPKEETKPDVILVDETNATPLQNNKIDV